MQLSNIKLYPELVQLSNIKLYPELVQLSNIKLYPELVQLSNIKLYPELVQLSNIKLYPELVQLSNIKLYPELVQLSNIKLYPELVQLSNIKLYPELVQLSNIKLYPELVRKFMCKLPHKFSLSPDDKPSAVLKCLSYELCTPLYIIFKMSLDSGICPSLWKSADITRVYKKGYASQECNYRPNSILPAVCRLFERILADNINYHLYQNYLITDSQYGFVKGRSTELQPLNSSSWWVKAVDSKRFVDTVYIDFSKAFDTVPHPKYKLPKYGIRGNMLQCFTSFLSDRKQRVKIGETCSGYIDV